MNFIVLLKQVPDISKIPPDAWDLQKGTLKRSILDNVLNPLDLHALTLAYRMRERSQAQNSKISCLTMGPSSAADVVAI